MSSSTTNSCIIKGTGCSSPTNLPEFIDSGACLCGLLDSEAQLNGLQTEVWRCIGNASADITHGSNGKWYNTSLPSEELSGINEPQNWGQNPPDTSQAYVLVDTGGQSEYQNLSSGGSHELIGADTACTGKNDTTLSEMFYTQGKGASKSSSTSSSASAASGMSSSSSFHSSTTSASGTKSSTTATIASTTSTSSTTAPTAVTPKSAAHHVSLKSTLLTGMALMPLVSLLM